MLIALWMLGISVGWDLPYNVLATGLDWIKVNPWESSAIALFLLLIGLVLLIRPREATEVSFKTSSKWGEVRVSQEALREIIARSALTQAGVRNVNSTLKHREEGLEITVIVQYNPDVIIPEVSQDLQVKITNDVEQYTGIRVAEVKVLVRSLEAALPARVR